MKRSTCRHIPLARNAMGKIDYCEACGVLTLHIGAISMRFDPESAESVWALLSQGLSGLHAELGAAGQQKRARPNTVS